MKKPFRRSRLRAVCGNIYYLIKRLLYWHFSHTKFAKKLTKDFLPVEIFHHQTVLLRRLKDVDMWMQENKIVNLKIAVKNLNGLVIAPGETFSFWRLVGNPTRRKGYLEGMTLRDGKVIAGVGGGLCQLSNLLYWMTLHTPLTVVERWRHQYDVFPDIKRKQPFGSGATVGYPNIDLQINNSTHQKFQLKLEVVDEYLRGWWLSDNSIKFAYEIVEKNHEIKHEWWGGYSRNNEIFRKLLDQKSGMEVAEEFVVANHALMMYEPLIEEKKP